MPRRNRVRRPRTRAVQVAPDERPPSPQQLAQQLVSRGLATPSILDTGRPKPQERTDAAP